MLSCPGPAPFTQNDAFFPRKPSLITTPAPTPRQKPLQLSLLHIRFSCPGLTTHQPGTGAQLPDHPRFLLPPLRRVSRQDTAQGQPLPSPDPCSTSREQRKWKKLQEHRASLKTLCSSWHLHLKISPSYPKVQLTPQHICTLLPDTLLLSPPSLYPFTPPPVSAGHGADQ